ncbi:unnamed protein product (mitochondrion) [Parajaminaea phylloscopi]|uniref:Uncharacterized protein n=1 Tax=Parajaminaea phylloscopi TaxID=1463510 RepID=A0AB39A6Y1_9BASI
MNNNIKKKVLAENTNYVFITLVNSSTKYKFSITLFTFTTHPVVKWIIAKIFKSLHNRKLWLFCIKSVSNQNTTSTKLNRKEMSSLAFKLQMKKMNIFFKQALFPFLVINTKTPQIVENPNSTTSPFQIDWNKLAAEGEILKKLWRILNSLELIILLNMQFI